MAYLFFILKSIAAISGFILFCSALLLREDEEGKIESILQTLWIRIDDLQKYALSRHTAFMKVIAGTMTTVFDQAFGKKYLSLEALTVSLCFCFASVALITVIVIKLLLPEKGVATFFLQILFIYTGFGLCPMLEILL